jgi:hypothetical protein
MALPPFTASGELPLGVHPASLAEVLSRFGQGTARRRAVASRLEPIYRVAASTGQLARFIVFGSFITAKPEPNDVDVFLLMEDAFDPASVASEDRAVFDHTVAQDLLGASIFWLRRVAAFGGEQVTVEYWQAKRGGGLRGIVEIVPETGHDPE